MNFYL